MSYPARGPSLLGIDGKAIPASRRLGTRWSWNGASEAAR